MDNNGCSDDEKAISVTLKDNSDVVQSVIDVKLPGKEAGDANANLSSLIAHMKKAKEEVNDLLTTLVNAEIESERFKNDEIKNMDEKHRIDPQVYNIAALRYWQLPAFYLGPNHHVSGAHQPIHGILKRNRQPGEMFPSLERYPHRFGAFLLHD
ncbi:hypothetical protein LSTR_LSTR013325 [Laodelphax striatellus]|uniref:Uncharacterized protein n=1 Tax=Laodelphax striatellus TaxID=195883 RepID=A0A482WQG4_LAOST|nr:hypothetical protein LSTR_LSTR013325 [Laodelphax striatellus]